MAQAGMRETYVARPGWAIVSVDYDSCELRTWGQILVWLFGIGNCVLPQILNDPRRCPHVEFGQKLWDASGRHITVEQAYALKGQDRKDIRGLAKGPNFGLPGLMGAQRLVGYCWSNYRVAIPLFDEPGRVGAYSIIKLWKEMYPEAQPYLDWVTGQVGKRGSKIQIKQFVSGRLRGQTGATDAANGYFQSLAADIAKRAGWRLVEACYEHKSSPLYGCRPLAFIHDEWLIEVPLDRVHDAGLEIARIMTLTAHEMCPDILFTAAPAAMYRWSKASGDPVFAVGGKQAKQDGPVVGNGVVYGPSTPGAKLVVFEDWLRLAA